MRGLGLLALVPVVAQAQEIVVTGRGLGDPAGDAAYDVVTIDAERLSATASGRIEDALKDVAGVQQFRRSDARSANPTSQGPTARGLGGNAAGRVLVLLDGVPQGDPFAGYLNWPLYTPERIGRVRVTRGGGSGASGSGALAGTIELESVLAGAAPAAAASLSTGSFGSADARMLASGRPQGGGFAVVSGSYARADGFVPVVPEQRGAADARAPYRQATLAARAVVPVGNSEIQGVIDAFEDRRTRGTAFSANRTTGGDASLRLVAPRAIVLAYVQMRQFSSEFASVDAARANAVQTLDQYNVPATGIGARAEYRPRLGATEVRIGGEWRRTAGETNELFAFVGGVSTRLRAAGGRSDIVGGFAEATRTIGRLTLTGGGRVDRWWLSEGFSSERRLSGGAAMESRFPARSGWEANGRTGAALAIDGTMTVRAAAYYGWRLPTLNELYRPFRVGNETTAANASLAPERSSGGEIGAEWRPEPTIRLGITGFVMRLSDAIANVTTASTPAAVQRERRNLDAVAVSGVEVDGSVRSGPWHGNFSLSITDPRISASGASVALNALRPAQVARVQASATLGWHDLGVTARYVGRQFEDDQNTRQLADAFTIDGVADVPLSRTLTLSLRVENLTDARVEAAVSASGIVERATPRTIWAGLRFSVPRSKL